VRQINQLDVATTVHWHGGLVSSEDDGHPTLGLVRPGQSFEHSYQNDQIAGFMWYHDHAIFATSTNVYHGMAGLYIHQDQFEDSLNLPSGEFDVPLVIQDRVFNADGSLFFPHDGNFPTRQGAFGDVMCVNGRAMPFLEVAPRKYRLRILNGSNARILNLRLSTGDGFKVIGSEHSFLPAAAETDHVFMSTGERYSIIVDFSKYTPGTRVLLTNDIDPDPYGDPFDGTAGKIMAFDVQSGPTADNSSDEVHMHPDFAKKFDPAKSVATREWDFERNNGIWTINGKEFDEKRIDAHPRRNTVETWHVRNPSGGWLHPAHPHLVKARIIERNGGPPLPWETGLKDMASLGANEDAKMLIFFDAPETFTSAHSQALYPMHCHNIDHEDHDMMTHWRLEP
jgi:FtsP/CotA-like multicopper oxidase with cupredoxin domain